MDPDGIMLSNGPGDPAENVVPIENLKKLLGKKPIFASAWGTSSWRWPPAARL